MEEKPKAKRQQQVRLEKLDADALRKLSRISGIEIPYLLREAVQLVIGVHAAKEQQK
jgi:hypothetical protein